MKFRYKIAIIDDSVFARKCVRAALGSAYEYVELDNPLEVRQALEREAPDLVLMDVNMPALAGPRLVEVIHRSSSFRCPIVLLSDTPEPELAALARACGAAGHICKTDDFARLRSAIELFLTALQARPRAEARGGQTPA